MVSTHSDLVEEAEDWASSVPKSLLESLPKKEIQRQSLIFELIQGEHKYLNDLTVVEQVSNILFFFFNRFASLQWSA